MGQVLGWALLALFKRNGENGQCLKEWTCHGATPLCKRTENGNNFSLLTAKF
jgi:hypothetical protein